MAVGILAERGRPFEPPPEQRMWLTTADAAKVLGVTRQWVGTIAQRGELRGELTRSGQWIFRRTDVHDALIARQEAKARSRSAKLAAVRLTMLTVGWEPRQMSLLPFLVRATRPRLVWPGEGAVSDRKVKGARSGAKAGQSEKLDYVNRKAAR